MDFFVFISQQWVLVSVLLILIYLFALNERRRAGATIGVHELTRLINGDQAVLVDLREAKDYGDGHISGALNIPYNRLAERQAELEKHRDKIIILVDKLGQHAAAGGRLLGKQGYQ
ncbi:MAG: rhodanese-like domain-containing protein, partial [bacterium]